jgi:hypothetical protein
LARFGGLYIDILEQVLQDLATDTMFEEEREKERQKAGGEGGARPGVRPASGHTGQEEAQLMAAKAASFGCLAYINE